MSKKSTWFTHQLDSPLALSVAECHEAKLFWIRKVQCDIFIEELKALQKQKSLSLRSSILSLNPFLDDNKLIRVGGRIENAPLSLRVKHPILLAPHPIVTLIVQHTYLRSLHTGVQLTLATLRREFWVLRARNLVKSVIHNALHVREKGQ